MAPGKKSQEALGRSLVRKRRKHFDASTRHSIDTVTSSGPAVSITENTSIDEFLSNAEAAQRSFEAERGRAAIANLGIVREDEQDDSSEEDDKEEEFCSIPKKPDWHGSENAQEFKQLETKVFLEWKRRLAKLQSRHPSLPPFEKNLEFWRQLWKIVELSDVVIQVVDARDPLFYYSYDLAQYVQEVSPLKVSVMLLNKADFLTQKQRQTWAEHFRESDTNTLFFSAVDDEPEVEKEVENMSENQSEREIGFNTARILTPPEVLVALRALVLPETAAVLTVGFLGYPNVGKSSTINRFLTSKKLQVSATPGKTKHYQTHVVGSGEIVLVDGPGLVIPDLRMTKAHMVLAGILPIDTLTDPLPCIDLLLQKVPFGLVQDFYGIMASCVTEAKKAERKNESLQILSALGLMRGFMKPGAVPDHYRAARLVLKDFVQGKLVFCQAPPNVDQELFCSYEVKTPARPVDEFDLNLEESFPELRVTPGVHIRGKKGAENHKRHGNKNKREKIRRVYNESSYA